MERIKLPQPEELFEREIEYLVNILETLTTHDEKVEFLKGEIYNNLPWLYYLTTGDNSYA